jgi:predicted DNA-binding transcriptional regulator AlpA
MKATPLKAVPAPAQLPDDPWLTSADLAARFRVPISRIHDWTLKKILPPGVKLGGSKHGPTRWRTSQVAEWEANRPVAYSGLSRRERAKQAAHDRL